MPDPTKFDPTKPLAMGRFNTVGGHALTPGDPITITPDGQEPKERGEVTAETALRLWAGGTFVYAEDARPTPVESPQDAARRLLAVDDLGGGHYLIRLPWLPGGSEKVRGQEAVDTRSAELIEAGQPADFDPAAIAAATPADAGGTGGTENGGGEGPSVEDRVAALVDGNTEKALRDRIAQLNEARAAAEPPLEALVARSDHDKAELARLIVGVDGDLDPPAAEA